MGKEYQGIKVLVEAGELLLDEGNSIRRSDEGTVIPDCHLLHLPPDALRIDAQKFRLLRDHASSADRPQELKEGEGTGRRKRGYLVKAIESEGKELGDVMLLRGPGEGEKVKSRRCRRLLSSITSSTAADARVTNLGFHGCG